MAYDPEALNSIGDVCRKIIPDAGFIVFVGYGSSWSYTSNLSPADVPQVLKAFASDGALAVVEGSEKPGKPWRPGFKRRKS